MKVLCPYSLFIANLFQFPSLARTCVLRLLALLAAMSQAVVASVGAAVASEDAAPGAVPMSCWRRQLT